MIANEGLNIILVSVLIRKYFITTWSRGWDEIVFIYFALGYALYLSQREYYVLPKNIVISN